MQDFVKELITGQDFSRWFLNQRHNDMKENDNLLEYQKIIMQEASTKLWNKEISWQEYVNIINPIIKYPPLDNLFIQTFDVVQSNDIEDFWPREDEAFEEGVNIDEDEFRKRVKEKL